SFLLLLFAYLLSSNLHQINDSPQKSAVDLDLGRVDNFNDSNYVIAFAPESKTTQEIMNKVASAPFMKGKTITGWPDENSMNELDLNYSVDAVRVIFNDMFSYHLKFSWGLRIPKMREHKDHSDRYGHRHSPWFFLKSSFWFQHQRADHTILENETPSDPSWDDSFEPVSPEFHGKEAIRIKNLKKEYTGKHEKVEALRGLGLDIYEGQITALLGHSGAGKTTLLNILSGLSAPTSGSVTIYNHTLSEMADFETVSKLTGVCPQSNVQFGFLTVRENLRLFAKIKGILPLEVEQEVQRVLQTLEMENIQDILAQNISGGQKRKLTFGIAILGDPQVLLLDEPTAGLDPLSRHRMWTLLKERKSDRVIVFSTQFMDEADILADRKVFISNGRLKCAGSSLFLKKRWGIGYQLSLHLNEMCDPESITSLVKQHIPDAKLTTQSEERLTYILPLERTSKFPDLYRDLDRCSNEGIENYGVSMTTLNEVFLKLEGKSTIDESDIETLQGDGAKDMGNLVELEQVLSSLHETKKTASGMALWRQQLCAIAKVRFLKLKKERKSLLTTLFLFGISFIPQLLEHLFYELYDKNYSWGLSPNMYFLSPGQPPQDPLTLLLVINKTGSSIDKFIHSLRRQDIALEVDALGIRNGTDEPSYNGVIIVSGDEKEQTPSEYQYLSGAFFWLPMVACFTPYIAMSSIGDYKKKVHSQLWISGLYPSAYWFGQALVDIPLYFLILLIMQIMDYVFSPEEIMIIIQNLLIQISYDSVDSSEASDSPVLFLALLIPYLHFFIFLFVLRCLERNFRKKSMRKDPVFRISPRSDDVSPNPEDPEGEDEDVKVERMRTANALTILDLDEKPVIIASCLRKEYSGKKKNCFSRRKKKIATRNISFCVKKGEVIGLLGHNGAGKSTTIKMITGDTKPTAGQVILKGSSGGDTPGFLGYCPQENVLWPNLTVREHLEVYAAVKGLKKRDASAIITQLVNALKLQDQLKAPVNTLSEGIKRKLCFVLSILGSPSVVLMDEPSTGMDPEGQQQMWQAIRATFRNSERGALLTTHYMAEAEAVCDRVAIMVSGRLKCIGSIQHLKSKFGKDYLLEMKVKTPENVEALHAEILRLFPQAARQESIQTHMYFDPSAVKQSFRLEEYSLSQSTLEQVFLELSKEQELDDFDNELDPSVQWKLLPQEET
ncbi:ATP-binding cassette sub-family A member 9, partial [Sciurus carolinensis]|nr:ATP-binding cassette sub-family A member 9 [Sciurus carolinensis]